MALIREPDKSEYDNKHAPAHPRLLSNSMRMESTTINSMGMCTHRDCLASSRTSFSCSSSTSSS